MSCEAIFERYKGTENLITMLSLQMENDDKLQKSSFFKEEEKRKKTDLKAFAAWKEKGCRLCRINGDRSTERLYMIPYPIYGMHIERSCKTCNTREIYS